MTNKQICVDCKKPVCSHCCVEIPCTSSPTKKNVWLCHICSEIRDIWKKTGAWFYGYPPGIVHSNATKDKTSGDKNDKSQLQDQNVINKKPPKTTKLGMEIESDDDEDETDSIQKEEPKIFKNGSFSSSFLRNRNLFNLRLSTDSSTRLMTESNSTLPKKSPVTPYSRQTSSSDSQKSANSLQTPQLVSDWDNASPNESQRRTNSISSCYSIAESVMGNGGESISTCQNNYRDTVQPLCLGWLEVSITYDESQDCVYCVIHRARDLPAMDAQGLSDPFCKVNIITPENNLRHTRWYKSRISHKTNNPEFNETFSFIGMSAEEIGGSSLYVVILDDDKYGNDFLGAVKIPLGSIVNCNTCRMTVPLGPEDKFSMESLSTQTSNGQILIALCYNTQKRALCVVIKRCINLLAMDKNGFSDAFVKLQLRPDSYRKKYKTSIKWRNLNPVFNEEFFFETRPNDLDKQTLFITVWDKDIGKSNDFLGSLILGQCSKGRRLKQWRDCLLLPDQYHEQWHCLSSEHIPQH
ncbi:double C2-like domain-containing protein beta isoform X2 [Chironomus tepperi]